MQTRLHTLVAIAALSLLSACSHQVINPEKHARSLVKASHTIYIEGGVLKVFSDDSQNLLYVYVRPRTLDRWVTAGGGGGNLDNPWLYRSAMFWAEGDDQGWYHRGAQRHKFSYLFDSKGMTLSVASGTYAVRRGELIVVALDENWQPVSVESGFTSLQVFEVSAPDRERLVAAVRKHYRGS